MKTDAMATLEREIARSGVDPFPIIERWLMVEGGQEVYLPRSFRDERNERICRLYSEGVTISQISQMFDLSQRTVRRIVRG
jgi:DNA-binding NarL/FixJ family response regulator